jgi:predicted DNA-binding protein (MmcQ/YjbR family)
MTLEDFKKYCLNKKGAKGYFPFDDEVLVFKVGSKMFALTNIKACDLKISLKCEPLLSIDLRRDYTAIEPGYHLNKKHWNTALIDGSMDDAKIYWLIDLSYDLVFKGLKKLEKEEIKSYHSKGAE